MSGKALVIATIVATIAACTPQPPPRGPVVIDQPGNPAKLHNALTGLGFTVAAAENGLPATLELAPNDPRAACRSIYLRDNFGERGSRGRFVDPDQVVIEAVTSDTNSLRLSARGRYLNRFDNRRTTSACDVSADFETEIRRALNSK